LPEPLSEIVQVAVRSL